MESDTPSRDGQPLQLVGPNWQPAAEQPAPAALPSGEPLLWSGRASLLLATGPCLRAALVLAVAVALARGWQPWGWSPPARPAWLSPWLVDVRVWSALAIGWGMHAVLELRSARYVFTPRHLRATRGFLVSRTVEYEWQHFRSVELVEPWLLRRARRAHVVLHFPAASCKHCGGPQQWSWTLRGVAGGPGLRRLLHQFREARE